MTQILEARAGHITPEMELVAQQEGLEAELIRAEVAAGRMVIPANKVHLAGRLEPMCIGIAAKCKINANIGNSAVTSDEGEELKKLHMAVHFGSDTVMDLSTGKDIDRIRKAIIEASPVPIGTVPIYQMLEELGGEIEDMRPQHFLDMVEHQAKQGVDYMTVHCAVLLEHLHLAMSAEHQVRRLEIAVDDALGVRIAHRLNDLKQDLHQTSQREALLHSFVSSSQTIQHTLQRSAVEHRHRVIELALLGDAEVQHREDVRVLQLRRHLSLFEESHRLLDPIRADELERHAPAEAS